MTTTTKTNNTKDFTLSALKRSIEQVTEKVTLATKEEKEEIMQELDLIAYDGLEPLINNEFFKNYAICFEAKRLANKAINDLYPVDSEELTPYEIEYNNEMRKGLRKYLNKNAKTSKLSRTLETSILGQKDLFPNEEVREKLISLCKQTNGNYALGRTLVKFYESKSKMQWKKVKGISKNLLKPIVISSERWERCQDSLQEIYDLCKNDLGFELKPIEEYHYKTLRKMARDVLYIKFIVLEESPEKE